MNNMLSIGLFIIKNLCFNFIFIIKDINVRFLVILLIREALVNDMWWQSAIVGGVKSACVLFSPFRVLRLYSKKSRLSKFLRRSFVDPRTCLVVLKSRSEAVEPGGGQWYLLSMLARFGYF